MTESIRIAAIQAALPSTCVEATQPRFGDPGLWAARG